MKKRAQLFLVLTAFFLTIGLSILAPTHAAFIPNLLMDDGVFDNTGSMNSAQIDTFLNGFSGSCISANDGFQAPDPTGYSPSGGFTYGGNVTAGKVIYDASQAYGINPQVILATLQKEQSLVTGGGGCSVLAYAAAAGYGCPDGGTTYNYSGIDLYSINGSEVTSVSGTCVNTAAKAGFSQQVIRAAWLLKFGEQRSEGNVNWAVIQGNWDNSDDPQTCYGGPMTQGSFQVCPNGPTNYYDGYTVIDGTSTHMDTGATAALYWYTPHFSGNQNFDNIFTSWFGGTVSSSYYSCHNATNVAGANTGEKVLPIHIGHGLPQALTLNLLNNTGSQCVEFHTWTPNLSNWAYEVATNLPAIDPANSEVITADPNGTGIDSLYIVEYRGTASGDIEIHGWDSTTQHWTSHVATNYPAVDPADYRVIAGNFAGNGKDEFALVKYQGTASGQIEVHVWAPGEQGWAQHVATNYPSISPSVGRVVIGHFNNSISNDELGLVLYNGTGSGNVEFHVWAPGEQSWVQHIATNYPATDPVSDSVIPIDVLGNGQDELALVKYQNTGSGNVEFHVWAPGEQSWWSHDETNVAEFTGP
jgi:hypothetical protein